MGDGEVYRASFTFSSATSAHPSAATVDGFGTIDLSQTPSIVYPTTKLSSEFLSFGHSLSIPGTGTLMFGQPKLSRESTDSYPDVFKWTIEIPVAFQNASQGYNSGVSLRCELLDGNGLWIGPKHNVGGIGAGPGMSESMDILFVIGISNGEQYTKQVPGSRGFWSHWERNADLENAKLVCRADEQELIFSLPLLQDLPVQ